MGGARLDMALNSKGETGSSNMPAMRSARTVRSLTLINTALMLSAFTVPAFADIETVVVTAEKRVENLQTVPVAVSAFTAESRDKIGIQTIQDMANFTPGMSYSTSTDRVTIRGISRQTNVLSADSGVANYTDGIYQSFAVEAGRSTLDLDRVEILRGPQGTLYGRNSIGGAINQITPRPSDTFKGEIRADYGAYDHSIIEGSLTGPINDDWQWRVYGDWEHQGIGYTKNILGPDEGQVLNKWYTEGQLQGKIGNIDIWDRAYWTVWNNGAGDAGAASGGWTPADFPTYEFGQGALIPNAGYGCTQTPVQALQAPGALGGNGFYPNVPAAGGVTTVEAGSVIAPLVHPCQNPSVANPWHIARIVPYTTSVPGAYFNTLQMTIHEDGYDVKYVTGAEWYRYVLTGPTTSGNIGNYAPPVAFFKVETQNANPFGLGAGVGTCAVPALAKFKEGVVDDAAGNAAGACADAVVAPQASFNYQQQEFFVQNELNFVSTGNGPLQWQTGLYWFQQHETQPVSAGNTTGPFFFPGQSQLATPISGPPPAFATAAPVPEGPFTLPHASLGNRWYDDRIRFNDTSLAAYGQVDYKITDEVTLTGGLRFSYDKKYGAEMNRLVSFGLPTTTPLEEFGIATPGFDLTPLGAVFGGNPIFGVCNIVIDYCASAIPDRGVVHPATYNAATGFAQRLYNHSSNALTGTAKITWQPDDTTTAYAYYSRGYKGGGFNTGIFSFINPKPWVDPEHVNAYEIGLKKTFGELLVLDAAAYYYDYSKMQVPVEVAGAPGAPNSPEFINVPHAVSEGFEAEAFITPIEHMTAIVSYSFDEAHITSARVPQVNAFTGVLAPFGVADPADPNGAVPGAKPLFTPAQCAAIPGSCGVDVFTLGTAPGGFGWVIPQSLKGQRLPNVPKNKIAINVQYDWNIPDLGTFTPSVSWRWIDKQYGTIFTRFYNAAPSWDQWDARVEFASPDSHWNVIVYGKNLANKIGYAQGGIGTRLSGTIDTGASSAPAVAGYCNNTFGTSGSFQTCNFVQGAIAGAPTPAPTGYGAIRGESIYGTTTNYNVNPPALYGIQLQYRFD